MSERARAAVLTLSTMAAIVALLCAVLVLANTQEWYSSPAALRTSVRASLSITVFAAVVSMALLPLLLWIIFSDLVRGVKPSPLMGPVLMVKGFLACLLALSAVSALDLLAHHLVLGWHWTDEPEIRLFGNALYLGLLGGLAWFLAVTMRRRGWSRRATAALFALMVAAGGLAVAFALLLA